MIDAINPPALRINTLVHLLLQLFLHELLSIEIQPAQIATIDAITITIRHEEFLGIPTNWKPQKIALVSMSLNRHIPATNHPKENRNPPPESQQQPPKEPTFPSKQGEERESPPSKSKSSLGCCDIKG